MCRYEYNKLIKQLFIQFDRTSSILIRTSVYVRTWMRANALTREKECAHLCSLNHVCHMIFSLNLCRVSVIYSPTKTTISHYFLLISITNNNSTTLNRFRAVDDSFSVFFFVCEKKTSNAFFTLQCKTCGRFEYN